MQQAAKGDPKKGECTPWAGVQGSRRKRDQAGPVPQATLQAGGVGSGYAGCSERQLGLGPARCLPPGVHPASVPTSQRRGLGSRARAL